MSTRERITVTLPSDVLAAIRTEAAGNVSAYTARALKAQAVRDAADRLAAWQDGPGRQQSEDLHQFALDQLDDTLGGIR